MIDTELSALAVDLYRSKQAKGRTKFAQWLMSRGFARRVLDQDAPQVEFDGFALGAVFVLFITAILWLRAGTP